MHKIPNAIPQNLSERSNLQEENFHWYVWLGWHIDVRNEIYDAKPHISSRV